MEPRKMFVKSKFGIDPEAEKAESESGPDKADSVSCPDKENQEATPIEASCQEIPPVSAQLPEPDHTREISKPASAPHSHTVADIREIISLKISDIDLYIGKKEAVMAELRSLIGQTSGNGKMGKRPSNYDEIAARIDSISDCINAKLAVRDELEKLKGTI